MPSCRQDPRPESICCPSDAKLRFVHTTPFAVPVVPPVWEMTAWSPGARHGAGRGVLLPNAMNCCHVSVLPPDGIRRRIFFRLYIALATGDSDCAGDATMAVRAVVLWSAFFTRRKYGLL